MSLLIYVGFNDNLILQSSSAEGIIVQLIQRIEMKFFTIITLCLCIFSCSSTRVKQGDSSIPLANNEGYLAIVFDSLDKIRNIRIENTSKFTTMPVGSRDPGISLMLLKVEEGEYCFEGFDVYYMEVTYDDTGFCTYVDAGEMNYFGDFVVRDPVSFQRIFYSRYVALLSQQYPELCEEFIGRGC